MFLKSRDLTPVAHCLIRFHFYQKWDRTQDNFVSKLLLVNLGFKLTQVDFSMISMSICGVLNWNVHVRFPKLPPITTGVRNSCLIFSRIFKGRTGLSRTLAFVFHIFLHVPLPIGSGAITDGLRAAL